MGKSFVQNIAFLILVNLIVKPFWVLGIDRTVQNTVGHEVYGIYQALFNITILFQILLDFGLQSYNSRVVSKSPMAMRNLFANIFVVKIFLAIVYMAIILAYGAFQGFGTLGFKLLGILGLMQIALSFLSFFRSNIAALQRFKTDSLLSVSDRFIAIAILSLLLFSSSQIRSDFNIEWYAWVQLIAYCITAVAAFFVCSTLQKIEWRHFKFKKIRIVIKQSIPYAIVIFLMALYMRIDVILLENISADGTIPGRYAAAFRLLDVSNNMSGVLIAGILLPLFAKMMAQKENYKSIVDLSISILFPFSVCLAVICSFWGYDVLHFLYKDIQVRDGEILLWLMCCLPLYCINYIYGTLLTANGNLKTLIGISAGGVALALILNTTMLSAQNPLNGVIAGRNAFITLLFVAGANLYFSQRKTGVSWSWKQIIQFSTYTFSLTLVAYLTAHYFSAWTLWGKIGTTTFAAFVLTLSSNVVNIGTVLQQIKKLRLKH